MKKSLYTVAVALCCALLSGCANQSQNVYDHAEVGKSAAVSFGTIIAMREVNITGKNSGTGALIGGAAGAGGGAYMGGGSGSLWTAGAGLIAGAVVGGLAEQAASNRKGMEYTVTLETGVTLTVVQNIADKEAVFRVGDRVIVQNTGGYQRVLPATHLPTEVKRPQGIKVVD